MRQEGFLTGGPHLGVQGPWGRGILPVTKTQGDLVEGRAYAGGGGRRDEADRGPLADCLEFGTQ